MLILLFGSIPSSLFAAETIPAPETIETEANSQATPITESELQAGLNTPIDTSQINTSTNAPENMSVVGILEDKAIYSSLSNQQLQAYIANPTDYSNKQAKNIGDSNGIVIWQSTYSTPRIWIEGIGDVYCIEPKAEFPDGNQYDNGQVLNSDGVKAILWWGFPSNAGGQYGLSDDEAYIRTWVALNAFIGEFDRTKVENLNDEYVNMLLEKADSLDLPQENLTITGGGVATYDEQTNSLITPKYTTAGTTGNFWLTGLESDIYMIDDSGKSVTSLPIGSSFRLATKNLSKNGTISFTVNTDAKKRASIMYTATGVQKLVNLQPTTTLEPVNSTATFEQAIGYIELTKKGENFDNSLNDIVGLQNAEFTITDAQGNKKLVKTDKNGFLKETLNPGNYTIEETKAPFGYKINTGFFGQIYKENFTVKPSTTTVLNGGKYLLNDIIKGSFSLKKVGESFDNADSSLKPLKGVEFKLEGLGLKQTLYTDATGNLKVDNLKAGNYKLTETKPLTGYHGTFDQEFVIDKAEEIFLINQGQDIINQINRGSFELIKVGETFDNSSSELLPLQGVTFRVTGFGYDKVLTTDEKGKISDKNLKPGKYTISETQTIVGYINNKYKEEFEIIHDGDNIKLATNGQLINDVIKGSAKLTKIGEQTDTSKTEIPLKGVVFRVTGLGFDQTFSTNEKGELIIPNLKYGKYTITEIKALDGYASPTYSEEFSIETNGQVVELNGGKPLLNKALRGSVHLIKHGESLTNGVDSFNPLAGVEFKVVGTKNTKNPIKTTYLTDKNGELLITDLKKGTYKITETKQADGYQAPDYSEEFAITKDGEIIELNGGIPLKNYAILADATLQKIGNLPEKSTQMTFDLPENSDRFIHNNQMHVPLENTEFTIVGINGTKNPTQTTFLTDKNGKILIKNLKAGEYKVTETKSRPGYDINQESTYTPYEETFVVDTHQKIYFLHGYDIVEKAPSSENELIPIINKLITNEIEITKRDFSSKEELPGATIRITEKKSNKVIDEWVSTETAHKTTLEYGDYQVCETLAPTNYELSTECIDISVTEAGITQKFDLFNKRKTVPREKIVNEIVVQKTDFFTGKALAGAKLTITDTETDQVIDEWISTTEKHTTNVAVGSYKICEEVAPQGYQKKDECIPFEVTENGLTQTFKFENKIIASEPVSPLIDPIKPIYTILKTGVIHTVLAKGVLLTAVLILIAILLYILKTRLD
ncbi:MAG: SpaA isopeptide-forming pilin-related protein [Mycoplasmatales bacterium]